ncbi:MAG: deiodinase-like protein [Gemmataceae bacterium]
MCRRYRDHAAFRAVYVREAHPDDGWSALLDVLQPHTLSDRAAVADRCFKAMTYSMPLLVDEINDPAGSAYSGMPDRLYVIDRHGKVAYRSGRGPFGFKPAEMEQALVLALLEQHLASPTATTSPRPR